MKSPRTTQAGLPFSAAEASHAEQRNLLGLALARVGASLAVRVLVEWVFNVGRHGHALEKSYAELAARPWGLCCSEGGARFVVNAARKLRLIRAEERLYSSLGQRGNAYTIDWDGVRALLAGRPGASDSQGGASHYQPPASDSQGGASDYHPYKETLLFPLSEKTSLTPPPTPSAAAAPDPRAPDPNGAEWAGAAAALCGVGIRRAEAWVEEFRAAGRAAAELTAAVEVYAANRARFRGPGVIAEFLRHGAWPTDAPLVDPAARAAAEAARADRQRAAAAEERRVRAEADRLEREHGAALDALDDAALDALLDGLPEATRATLARLRLAPRASALARGLLLGLLDARAAAAGGGP